MTAKEILKQIGELSRKDKIALVKSLEMDLNENFTIEKDIDLCPHCTSDNFIKKGKFQDRVRYKCKECNKTFTSATGTSISWIKKKQYWKQFLELTLASKSIRDIAKELNISTKTAFLWRHRVISSLEKIYTKKFKGLVETDDLHVKFDQKGRKKNYIKSEKKKRGDSDQSVKVFVMLDRDGTVDMKPARKGRLRVQDLEKVVDLSRLTNGNVLISDMHPSIRKFYKDKGLTSVSFKADKKVKDKVYHLQTLNNLAADFKNWMKNYKSVSTKHLEHYLQLYMMQRILKKEEDKDRKSVV